MQLEKFQARNQSVTWSGLKAWLLHDGVIHACFNLYIHVVLIITVTLELHKTYIPIIDNNYCHGMVCVPPPPIYRIY